MDETSAARETTPLQITYHSPTTRPAYEPAPATVVLPRDPVCTTTNVQPPPTHRRDWSGSDNNNSDGSCDNNYNGGGNGGIGGDNGRRWGRRGNQTHGA